MDRAVLRRLVKAFIAVLSGVENGTSLPGPPCKKPRSGASAGGVLLDGQLLDHSLGGMRRAPSRSLMKQTTAYLPP